MSFPPKVNPPGILAVALDVFEKEGWEGLSMRVLAKHLGLTVSSLYRHYPHRLALEQAMAESAANALREKLSASPSFPAALEAYRDFARARPRLFSLLFSRPGQSPPFKDLWNTFLGVVATVTGDPDDTDAAVAIWSFLQGFVALEQSGQFGASGPRGGFERGVAALVAGLSRESG